MVSPQPQHPHQHQQQHQPMAPLMSAFTATPPHLMFPQLSSLQQHQAQQHFVQHPPMQPQTTQTAHPTTPQTPLQAAPPHQMFNQKVHDMHHHLQQQPPIIQAPLIQTTAPTTAGTGGPSAGMTSAPQLNSTDHSNTPLHPVGGVAAAAPPDFPSLSSSLAHQQHQQHHPHHHHHQQQQQQQHHTPQHHPPSHPPVSSVPPHAAQGVPPTTTDPPGVGPNGPRENNTKAMGMGRLEAEKGSLGMVEHLPLHDAGAANHFRNQVMYGSSNMPLQHNLAPYSQLPVGVGGALSGPSVSAAVNFGIFFF